MKTSRLLAGLLGLCLLAGCATKPQKAVIGRPEGAYLKVVFSPDGRTVAAIPYSGVYVVFLDVTNRLETARFKPPKPPKTYAIQDVAYAPDGCLMAEETCSEALANLLEAIASDPQWTSAREL